MSFFELVAVVMRECSKLMLVRSKLKESTKKPSNVSFTMYDVCISICAGYVQNARQKIRRERKTETKRLVLQGVVKFERASANSEASIMSTLNSLRYMQRSHATSTYRIGRPIAMHADGLRRES
jgi:hypothetical protein